MTSIADTLDQMIDTSNGVVALIQAGAKADPDDIAELLSMSDKEFRKLLTDIAAEGEDEPAWVVLLSPGVIKRTQVNLTMMAQALRRSRRNSKDNEAAFRSWRSRFEPLQDALSTRLSQGSWAVEHRRTLARQTPANQFNAVTVIVAAKRTEALAGGNSEFARGQLDVIEAIKAAIKTAANAQPTANE